jgi:hypothetical protein
MAMRNIDPAFLAALRAQAEEVRAGLEEREGSSGFTHLFNDDPEAEHDAVMAATQPDIARQRAIPPIIHKTNKDARVLLPDPDDGDDPIPPTFTDEQLDTLATSSRTSACSYRAGWMTPSQPRPHHCATGSRHWKVPSTR